MSSNIIRFPSPASRFVTFCGAQYDLRTLGDEEFYDLFNQAIERGCELHLALEGKDKTNKLSRQELEAALVENTAAQDTLEIEFERRERFRSTRQRQIKTR